ncbi:hypothetical protein NO1_0906 [Candidatus Termititenax aidoneus]|uniref:Phage tail fiber protein n=1 Tax=Termititenax aidoneus TaxID=2218524 RepID=A0A388TAQ1_TERA1|nr:hypothetical protein NO1_0906 [Candidatus Termititenax aidoneus]
MASNYTDTTDTDFTGVVEGVAYNIDTGKPLSAAGVRNALHTKENVANKTVTVDSSSTDAQYPSAKAVMAVLSDKASSSITYKSSGGSNALTAAMLPKHTHTIYTDATKNTNRTSDKSLTGSFGVDDMMVNGSAYSAGGILSLTDYAYDAGSDNTNKGKEMSIDATHEHTGNANNDNSTIADTNTSNMPAYYALIYIMRVS